LSKSGTESAVWSIPWIIVRSLCGRARERGGAEP